ncbi:MAG TPA: choline/carnitine O-acyltransferase, partial [Pseudogracilibacillus sp.]|nr:choline/carnitine O-acyltransferase [Pseudogracilibacillus sp.]
MYINEDKLPSLPIPELNETKKKLLEWLAPILTEEQLASSKEKIDTFFAANGHGEILQTKLHAWDNNLDGSWLKPLWDDVYLMHRDSLPLSSNFNVLLESIGENIDLAEVTAKIGILTAGYYHDIIDEKIEPELMRGQPLDMGQYQNFFRSVRIPQAKRDDFYIAPYTKENNYLVVLYRNHLLKVAITDDTGKVYDSRALTNNIQAALQEVTDIAPNGTIFTAANREKAAEVYNLLQESEHNKQLLDMIADALLLVSIDERSTTSVESIRSLMTATDNKYFDKTVQIMLTKHGEIGFNMEHATIDGTSIASFIGYISRHLRINEQYEGNKTVPAVKVLVWDLNKEMQAVLQEIEAVYRPLQEKIALLFEPFTDFGAGAVKKMKLSPDGFFHMA